MLNPFLQLFTRRGLNAMLIFVSTSSIVHWVPKRVVSKVPENRAGKGNNRDYECLQFVIINQDINTALLAYCQVGSSIVEWKLLAKKPGKETAKNTNDSAPEGSFRLTPYSYIVGSFCRNFFKYFIIHTGKHNENIDSRSSYSRSK